MRHAPTSSITATARVPAVVGFVGTLALLVGAWGGIAPYVGPVFGWSPDGAVAWHWALAPGVLALAPGALAVVAAVTLLSGGRRRSRAGSAGFLLTVAGAWFVIGPLAWRVLERAGAYFPAAAPLRELTFQVGSNLGPGLIVLACGAMALGWAGHRSDATAAQPAPQAPAPPAPSATPDGGVGRPVLPADPTIGNAPPAPSSPVTPG